MSIPPENADALDLLHQWQSEDAAYDREAWARLTLVIEREWVDQLSMMDRELLLVLQQAAIIVANAIRRRLGLPAIIVPKRER